MQDCPMSTVFIFGVHTLPGGRHHKASRSFSMFRCLPMLPKVESHAFILFLPFVFFSVDILL